MTWRLRGFTIRGFGPFDREYSVDLEALGPEAKVVAICGENGAGKTTALELASAGAMYRDMPTRGSLVDLATTRDAFLESRFVNGAAWTVRHLVDAVSRKSEAVVLDEDEQPVLADAKVSSFDAWAAEHLPTQQVFFATALTPQGAGGFAACKPTARKEVLLSIMGPEVERLEQYAAHCREQLKTAKATLDRLQARIADEEARGGDGDALTAELVSRRQAVEAWTGKLTAARDALAQAEAQARAREAALEAEQRRQAEIAKAQQDLAAAREGLAKLEAKVAANQNELLGNAEAIRAAAARLPQVRQWIAERAAELATARAECQHFSSALSTAKGRLAQAEQRRNLARDRTRGTDDVKAAAERLPALRAALKSAEADLAREEESLEAVVNKRAAGAEVRLDAAIGTLREIASIGENEDSDLAIGWARDRLDADAEQVRFAAELPKELAGQMARRNDYRARKVAAEKALRDNELAAARAAEIEQARRELEAASLEANGAAVDRDNAQGSLIAATQKRDAADGALGALERELAELEPLAIKLPHLDKAEARLAELEPLVAAGKAEVLRLEQAVAAIPPGGVIPGAPAIGPLQRDVQQLESELASSHRAVAQTEERLAQAVASRARVLDLTEQRGAAEAEAADWSRLAADLGRDGLQAMVIDQAIPEINETCNELLHAAFGPRFTVDVRTQVADSKGKRLLETLDVWVIDTGTEQRRGREGLIETFSGGEKTILAEALSLGLTQLACRLAGAERPTLIRDESAGQLSEGNAPLWMAMMRRAADIMNVDRILFVNHDRQTWDLADERIWIGGAP